MTAGSPTDRGVSPAENASLADGVGVERRARPREQGARVTIGNQTFSLRDWASNSALLVDCRLDVRADDKLNVHCSIPLKDERLEFDCEAYVVRVDPELGHVALLFSGIGRIARAQIEKHFAES